MFETWSASPLRWLSVFYPKIIDGYLEGVKVTSTDQIGKNGNTGEGKEKLNFPYTQASKWIAKL